MKNDVDLTDHPDPAALRPAAMWLRYDSRADGWTPGRRAAFLTHLADHGVVAEAAAAVGKSLASAYALRRRAGGYGFNLGWEAALLLARRRVADELMAAAIKGETAVWTREEGKTTYTRFNPRTALALLDRANPATALNEILAVAQHFDWFRDLIDASSDLWPLFDTCLDESDFDARNRVRISLQLSDESADFEGADKHEQLESDDEKVPPIEYKSMPVEFEGHKFRGNKTKPCSWLAFPPFSLTAACQLPPTLLSSPKTQSHSCAQTLALRINACRYRDSGNRWLMVFQLP